MHYPPSPYKPTQAPVAPVVRRHDVRRVWQLVLGVVLFIVAQVVGFLPLVISKIVQSVSTSGPASVQVEIDFGVFTVQDSLMLALGMFVGAAISVAGYLFIVAKVGKFPGNGMAGKRKSLEFVLGVAVGIALIALSVGVIWVLGGYRITGLNTDSSVWASLLIAVAIGVGPGFTEEILFRGFGFRILDAWLGWWPALIITATIFGLIHLTNPEATVFGAIAICLEAGILLAAAYLLTRRLWLAIGIHTGWNFTQAGIFSSDVSGTGERHGIFVATWPGPDWLTGGSMGMEGSVVTVVIATAAGFAMLGLAHKHGLLRPSTRREKKLAAVAEEAVTGD